MENVTLARNIYIRHKGGVLWLEENDAPPKVELEEMDPIHFSLAEDDFDPKATITEIFIYISPTDKDRDTNRKTWSAMSNTMQPYSYLKIGTHTAGGTDGILVSNAGIGHEDISIHYAINVQNGKVPLVLDPEMIIKKKKDRT